MSPEYFLAPDPTVHGLRLNVGPAEEGEQRRRRPDQALKVFCPNLANLQKALILFSVAQLVIVLEFIKRWYC